MSMERKRPQLSLNELHQLRWLLGGLLALVSIWSVWYLDIDAWLLLLITSVACLATLIRPTLPARWPRWVHKFAFPVVLGILLFDLYTFGELLPALVRLAIVLLLYRVSTYRKRRDDLQLILLGLFLIVTTGVLTVSIGFALQIMAFTALALGLLLTRTLVDAAEAGKKVVKDLPETGAPTWAQVDWRSLLQRAAAVSDWRVWGLGLVLFGGLVALSALLFLAIPRFQVDSSLFLDRWMKKRSVTGFTDTLRFGEVSDIQKDESIAMRVEISDPTELPAELYWRMIVLDQYRNQAFRMSSALQLAALSEEHIRSRLDVFDTLASGKTARWTFYVEPGVSRYLPLTGGFSQLEFTEPQTLRYSQELRLVVLTRDPATMKAYRTRGMDTSGVLRETNAWIYSLPDEKRTQAHATAQTILKELPFADDERAIWSRASDEIKNGRKLRAQEFAREAVLWLHERHTYSLRSEVPPGEDDPLTRWTLSRQPGHCELFAGAFTMLARAAGFPTRVVAGFLGGAWNGDYLIVRNSNAHAWCEINDGAGNWLRVDPTAPPTQQMTAKVERNEEARSHLRPETGWMARFDRVRMLWYRRIVSFDRQDQINLTRTLRQRTEASGKQIKLWIDRSLQRVRGWISRPWDLQRIIWLTSSAMIAAGLVWLWQKAGRDWWLRWQIRHQRGVDPIRREAGRWLSRFEALPDSVSAPCPPEQEEVKSALQRLRYGPKESWPAPDLTLRRARQVFRKIRRTRISI